MTKNHRYTFRLDAETKRLFDDYCKKEHLSVSSAIIRLIYKALGESGNGQQV